MLAPLTPKQKLILEFINLYYQANKLAPSLEEIKQHFNLSAISTVHEHIERLKQKGYLQKDMNQARGIRLTNSTLASKDVVEINLLGNIAAGQPIEAVENAEPLLVSAAILPHSGNFFALEVKGDSMIEEGIFDGDLAIIKSQVSCDNGDTVVAVVEKDFATLKKFYKEKNIIRLQPANARLKPMYYREVEIRGKLVALIRKY